MKNVVKTGDDEWFDTLQNQYIRPKANSSPKLDLRDEKNYK